MKGRIKAMEALSYADVTRFRIELEGGVLEVEIPLKLLQDVGVNPEVGTKVEVELSAKPEELEPWQIVLAGEVYLKQEAQGTLYASAGGLQIVMPTKILTDNIDVGGKVYLKLRFEQH
ncbi:MAG: hypothetical protein ABWK01_02715 [Infirmifilum sp.]